MKRNDTYLSPGRGPSPAEKELDSDNTECLRCGEWAGICVCEGGPWLDDEEDEYGGDEMTEILNCQPFSGFIFVIFLAIVGGIIRKQRGK